MLIPPPDAKLLVDIYHPQSDTTTTHVVKAVVGDNKMVELLDPDTNAWVAWIHLSLFERELADGTIGIIDE